MKRKIYEEIFNEISNHFGLNKDEILTHTKKREVVDARQAIYYVCHHRGMRISHIQSYLKQDGYGVTHSTIINGLKIVEKNIKEDEDYKKIINRVCTV